MKMKCLIVDDEPMARKGMEEYVSDVPFLEHVGSFENAQAVAGHLKNHSVDLMLLDIQMPNLNGIEFLKLLVNPPLVIFTTAHPDYALEGYSLDVIDYLVKPTLFARFQKAVTKAFEFHSLRTATAQSADYFFIKCDQVFEKVSHSEVLYVEAMQNYAVIHSAKGKRIAYITLTALEEKLPKEKFMRVHKSFIVSLDKITALDGHELMIGTAHIPVSRTLKDDVLSRVMGDNLIKR
ncbi:LytR/AlgR family response regulator transcription factor [Chryseolinea lacunae]|uniref:Response regulator transcription factor n=1 Tax=Chryseolinea lacunae TaxID=2801331 RepID=A0ABS1L1Y4_9BACT|nr:LytTR family DNA-binding domain-containing protein [Chryseolinea lacunae]MBL0745538.1 response regulator transcription factor [Chryseolinea lacunae]